MIFCDVEGGVKKGRVFFFVSFPLFSDCFCVVMFSVVYSFGSGYTGKKKDKQTKIKIQFKFVGRVSPPKNPVDNY